MDGATLCRFPHLTWMHISAPYGPEGSTTAIHSRLTNHLVYLHFDGVVDATWIEGGREQSWCLGKAGFHFKPVTDSDFTLLLRPRSSTCRGFTIKIPRGHLDQCTQHEGIDSGSPRELMLRDGDRVIHGAITKLWLCHSAGKRFHEHADEAARHLVLRLIALSGGRTPDWHDDASVFDRRTLYYLVECIDAHLKIAPSLGDMGMRVGLSPSHFAKKFRQTTGVSLNRFINRRRIFASLEMLKSQPDSLASIALDLGFTSQSHFTRLFSDLTGTTPAKYRKRFRRTVG